MFARSQPPTSDPSTIFKVACDRLRTFNDARGGQTRFASRIRANPTGTGRRERERERMEEERGTWWDCNSFHNSRSLAFFPSFSSSLYVSSPFSYLWVRRGLENRGTDSLPERRTLLRFTTVFRKMYRRAPRYTTNCRSLVLLFRSSDIYDNQLCRSSTSSRGKRIPSKIERDT